MKRILTVAVTGTLLAMAVVRAEAAAAKTKFVQNLNIALTVWSDGDSKSATINSKNVIEALTGTNVVQVGLTRVTNVFNFGKSAQLLYVTDLATSNNTVVVRVVTKGVKTDADVSNYFTKGDGANVTVTRNFVAIKRGIQSFGFQSGFLGNSYSFTASGFATETKAILVDNQKEVTKSLTAAVAGTATRGAQDFVAVGTISFSGGHEE